MVCLNGVYAFGYNSAGSERILMKFGAHRVYYLELALADFGHDPRRSKSGRASRNFFCAVNNARLYRFPVSTKFAHKTWIWEVVNPVWKHLWKFACKGTFFQRQILGTVFNDFGLQATISPKWLQISEIMTGWPAYGMLAFHLCPWNQLRSFPWPAGCIQVTTFRLALQT